MDTKQTVGCISFAPQPGITGYSAQLPALPVPVNDPVDHPAHYTDGGIETVDFIEAKRLNWHRGNAIKYISRAGKKGPPEQEAEDIRKAIWYLQRDLQRMERAGV